MDLHIILQVAFTYEPMAYIPTEPTPSCRVGSEYLLFYPTTVADVQDYD